MGALHAGHLTLVERARAAADHVAVSLFVNPTQFAPHEDFHQYPRPLERDLTMCRAAGVDLVFAPSAETMYPPGVPRVSIDVPALSNVLEGAVRPGHFAGVCEIVTKLFNLLRPDVACFGEKDFQQLAVVRAMVAASNGPTEILACPTARDADGLAMSSRNRYLSPAERRRGLSIGRALSATRAAVAAGQRDAAMLRQAMRTILEDAGGDADVPTAIDYATIVDARTFAEVNEVDRPCRAIVAMRVGGTRLIDNVALE